jgi:arylsulfatase A-like enzyme
MANITELATGFPGYNGIMPKEKAGIGAMLRQYGYNTFCVGKWHNTPDTDTGPEGCSFICYNVVIQKSEAQAPYEKM